MKTLLFAISLAALTAGFAPQASAYDACAGSNSPACVNARNAFAEHHGGVYPRQFENRGYNNGGYYNNRAYNNGAYYNNNRGYYAESRHHHHHHDHDRDDR